MGRLSCDITAVMSHQARRGARCVMAQVRPNGHHAISGTGRLDGIAMDSGEQLWPAAASGKTTGATSEGVPVGSPSRPQQLYVTGNVAGASSSWRAIPRAE